MRKNDAHGCGSCSSGARRGAARAHSPAVGRVPVDGLQDERAARVHSEGDKQNSKIISPHRVPPHGDPEPEPKPASSGKNTSRTRTDRLKSGSRAGASASAHERPAPKGSRVTVLRAQRANTSSDAKVAQRLRNIRKSSQRKPKSRQSGTGRAGAGAVSRGRGVRRGATNCG